MAIGDSCSGSFIVRDNLIELIRLYIDLEASVPPRKDKGDGQPRARAVYAPLPVHVDTIEVRAQIRSLIRRAVALREEMQAFLLAANATEQPELGSCTNEACSGRLRLNERADELVCSLDADHGIPKALWTYYDRKAA